MPQKAYDCDIKSVRVGICAFFFLKFMKHVLLYIMCFYLKLL